MSKNDEKILILKEQIAKKKAQLNKAKKFIPATNCSIELEGQRSNIQVLNKEQLLFLLIKLNVYAMSAKNLEVIDQFIISGYHINDWIEDIKSRIDILNYKEEENKLRDMESKLDRLLSSEKKTELEINEIESLLQ